MKFFREELVRGLGLGLLLGFTSVLVALNIAASPYQDSSVYFKNNSKHSSDLKPKPKNQQAGPQMDVNGMRIQAAGDIQVAVQLYSQADSMVKLAPTREKVKLAIDLFIRAGQSAEKAAAAYKALAPTNATQEEVAMSQKVLENCLSNIAELKRVLAS
jgi:hypothetical protein